MKTAVSEDESLARERDSSYPALVLADIYPGLVRTAHSLVGPDKAEDVTHDTLIEMLSRHPRFEGIDNPMAYGRVILFRLSYSLVKRGLKEVPSSDTMERLGGSVPDAASRLVDRLFLEGALDGLGRRQRGCVVLSRLYGLTDREIADLLGCRPSTVRSQIARGLKVMRTINDLPV